MLHNKGQKSPNKDKTEAYGYSHQDKTDAVANPTWPSYGIFKTPQQQLFGDGAVGRSNQRGTFPPPPPFNPGGHLSYHHPPPPYSGHTMTQPTDPVTQLTQALQAVLTQPQRQMERYLARQTLGRDLPMFTGDVEEWPAFYSFYKTSSQECAIPDSQNLVRLQKCLKGKARESVRALLVSDKNVNEILRVLEKNFGQPSVIIRSLMEKARKTPSPREDDYDSLVQFGDCVRNLVKTVEALGKKQYLQNPQLIEELTDKLPSSLRLQWASLVVRIMPAEPTMTTFSGWLENLTDAAIVLNRNVSSMAKENEDKKASTTAKQRSSKPLAKKKETTLATESEEKEADRKPKSCSFCEKPNHEVVDCRSFLKLEPAERQEWVKKFGKCFCCLKGGHRIGACYKKKNCEVDGCTSLHHHLLHDFTYVKARKKKDSSDEESKTAESDEDDKADSKAPTSSGVTGHINNGVKSVLLRIVPVVLQGPKGELDTYALCDEASTVSLIDSKIAAQLGMDGPKDPLHLRWTNATSQEDNSSKRVSLKIRGKNENKNRSMQNVRTIKNLSLPVQSIRAKQMKEKWTHLRDVDVKDYENAKPTLLIGQDHIHLIIARQVIEGPPNAPIASFTKLGWMLHGNLGKRQARCGNFSLCTFESNEEDRNLHELVKESFSLDSLGIIENSRNLKSRDDLRAEKLMETFTMRNDDRFETCLLWKYDEPKLPNNKEVAVKRLLSIEKKMDRNPEFALEYCKKVQYYLDMGYARKLTEMEASQVSPLTWYLPHFFAFHPNKPAKPRFVFDAAAEFHGQSLNSNLLAGPDVLKSLPGILLKFREKRIAFTADIREMFHQVMIREKDQDAQRFLWRGENRESPPSTYVMRAMIFGSACSPYAAQFVKNKNAMEHNEKYPEAVNSIINHHYVDDLADGADSEEQAIKLIRDIIQVHAKGGFEIVKWCCSSKEVLQQIPAELRAVDVKSLDLKTELPMERVLGLKWGPNADMFQFATSFNKVDPDIISGKKIPTKREVLKTVMSVFDPLGFISHYMIKAKILYQEIWRTEIAWDDKILSSQQPKWNAWIMKIPDVASLAIPRHYFKGQETGKSELHVFCDASSEAYSAIGYIRHEDKNGRVDVKMVMAKARVASLKPQSIPRLELQSALVAVRMSCFIIEEQNLKFDSVTYWTDSKTVVLWLRNDAHRYKSFVAHRVGEILEKSNVTEWKWLSTKLNPADDATRSNPMVKLKYDTRWFQGPGFLREPADKWPRETIPEASLDNLELEMKKEYCAVQQQPVDALLPDVTRFSNWSRLVRATAWFCRGVAAFKLKKKNNVLRRQDQLPTELTVDYIQWAEMKWVKKVQHDCFPGEIECLTKNVILPRESRINFLSPFLDKEGILRVSSRTIRSPELSPGQKEPIVLDPGHRFTKLVIMHYHVKALHQGQEFVVNELRQKYWILRMRSAVKSVWSSCLICKQRRAKPREPEIAPLPEFRVTMPVRPFTVCGLDYFGPLTVAKFRKHEKRWCALFACMHTRAIHLELVDNLSTDSVIMAMTRMSSVRGWPSKFYSDNGTNFRGAATELKRSLADLDFEKITGEMALKEVEFNFIPPYTAHFGGSWERMVRSVKRALEVILKERAPKEETLRTLLAEAMNVVNSRPLTYVPNDKDDPEVLTPNSFMIGTTSTTPLLGEFEDRDLCLRKQWRVAQRLADHFWKRWVKEYLRTLTRKQKWTKSSVPVKVGDVVLVVDDNLPRNIWPKGVIVKVYPGQDGIIRVVDVKTKTGVFRRSVAKLCVLYDGEKEKEFLPVRNTPGEHVGDAEQLS